MVILYAVFATGTWMNPNRGGNLLKIKKPVHQRVIALYDVHLDSKTNPSKSYLVAKKFILSMQPTHIILAGDFCSMESLSHWAEKKGQKRKMEGRRYSEDVFYAKDEIEDLRDRSPDSEIIYMEGNHENWLQQYVDRHPELEGALDFAKDLELERMGISWVAENDVYTLGKLNYIHGWFHNEFYAKRTLLKMGDNVICGHKHSPQKHADVLRARKQCYACWGIGCLCDLNPFYMRNKPNAWHHGLAYVEYRHGGEFQVHDLQIIDGKLSFGGYSWEA